MLGPPPHFWSSYLTEIGPLDTVALKGAVSLAERSLATFVIGLWDGGRITVRGTYTLNTYQFTMQAYYINKTETLLRK